MIVIPQKEYANKIEDELAWRIGVTIKSFVIDMSHEYDFDWLEVLAIIRDTELDYTQELAEKVILWMEECGFPVRGDGKDY